MNVIVAYLETMFSTYPQTPRLLEAKAELQGMMEDAYLSLIAEGRTENEAVGQVIRDFGNLDEVAPVLGITSDISGISVEAPQAGPQSRQHPPVTMEEAQGYADAQHRIRFRVSTAVMVFVLSPAALIAVPVAAQAGLLPITEQAGVFIGLLVLLALVAVGITLLLSTSSETAPFKHIAEGRISANPAVARWAGALAARHERGRIRALQIAIALWLVAPIPLLAFALFLDDAPQEDVLTVIGVVIVLVIVAAGLGILLPQTWAHTVAENLGGSTSAAACDAAETSVLGVIAAIYWPLLVATYVIWSFISNAWGTAWIVLPIGAVLFGAIAAGCNAIEGRRRSRR